MIAIIDYDAGNIKSVEKALQLLGQEVAVTRDEKTILSADGVILPGVGAFGDAMEKLHAYGLVEPIRKCVAKNIPFLGICLGLQLMFRSSEEAPGVEGLNILDGEIVKIPAKPGLRIPHIGWNSVSLNQTDGIFENLRDNSYFYFVHSYYLKDADEKVVAGTTEYGVPIQCAVQQGRVSATQFHPEKSSEAGLTILRNFVNRED